MVFRSNNRNRIQRKNRFDRSIIGMVLLCVTAILVALIITREEDIQVQATESPKVVAEYDTVSVPVPASHVPTGTKVKNIRLTTVAYPKHQLPRGILESVENYLEATTIAPLPANLPIFAENLSFEVSGSNPIIESIPAGMRAMTLKVDATSSVEGWAGSGSIVDVLLVETNKTSVIAENVKILSAERSIAPINGSAVPNVPKTVTLLVTQEQCLAINTAIPLGRIAFALRGSTDDAGWKETIFLSNDLKAESKLLLGSNKGINGYIEIKEKGVSKKYALSGDNWIPTESVPDGFLPTRDDNL